jgi:protein associated with RNAse G/E
MLVYNFKVICFINAMLIVYACTVSTRNFVDSDVLGFFYFSYRLRIFNMVLKYLLVKFEYFTRREHKLYSY